MELIKNSRFRTGEKVDIYHSPVWEGNTTDIIDISAGGYTVQAVFAEDLTAEMIYVGDIAAFSFGVGIITAVNVNDIHVDFPNSMFPDNDIAKYVGRENQHTLIFSDTGKVEAGFTVAKYTEVVNQATYGYAKVVYNLQTEANLILTPVRLVDDGILAKVLYSKGYVLKSCNDENYTPTNTWNGTFPLELSGTSIDPIYRRAYLIERGMESKGRKAKAKMTFKLIG